MLKLVSLQRGMIVNSIDGSNFGRFLSAILKFTANAFLFKPFWKAPLFHATHTCNTKSVFLEANFFLPHNEGLVMISAVPSCCHWLLPAEVIKQMLFTLSLWIFVWNIHFSAVGGMCIKKNLLLVGLKNLLNVFLSQPKSLSVLLDQGTCFSKENRSKLAIPW